MSPSCSLWDTEPLRLLPDKTQLPSELSHLICIWAWEGTTWRGRSGTFSSRFFEPSAPLLLPPGGLASRAGCQGFERPAPEWSVRSRPQR